MTLPKTIITVTAIAAMALAGCTTTSPGGGGDVDIYGSNTGGTIKNGVIEQRGSSTVFPLAELWAEDFGTTRQIAINVAGGGSGAGASGLCAKEIDLGDMSRAMKDSEKQTCRSNGVEPVEWKVAFDGLSVVVDKDNTFVQDLSIVQLKSIFVGEDHVTTWNEVDPAFPDTPIRLCYPDSDSGTYEYFNEEVLGHEFETVGPRTGGGVQQSPDDNVLVNCLSSDVNAIGYFGYAYVIENLDKVRAIKVEGVAPTDDTIADGSYAPLSRPIYIYTNGIPQGILRDYFAYAYHPDGGQFLVPETGYVPLDEGTRTAMLAQLG